jgi:hypothetical protein
MKLRSFQACPCIAALVLFVATAVSAQTTAFTYQGRLTDASLPPTGQYDFIFTLYDSGGNPLGSLISRDDVQVVNGIFTVSLDFGATSFSNSAASTIEIAVRPGASTGPYTTLTPRQPLTSTPYAIKSIRSALADDAAALGGQPPSAYGSSAQLTALQTQLAQLQAQIDAATVGTELWSKTFGDTSSDAGLAVAVDASGNVFIAGRFGGVVNFGGGSLFGAGQLDIFVAKYSGTTGQHIWSKRFGSTLNEEGTAIAVDPSGNVFVTGYFEGTVDFGGVGLVSAGSSDVFLLKLNGTTGAHIWSRRFGGTSSDVGNSVAVDPMGTPAITGTFSGTADFGGSTFISSGSNDIFASKYDRSNGGHLWSRAFGGTGSDDGLSIATDSSGNAYVTGYYLSSAINFGGGALTNAGNYDGYLVKLASADGSHVWSKRFGGGSVDRTYAVAARSGSVFVTGDYFSASIDFGGGAVSTNGPGDAFLAKFDTNGAHQWSRSIGGISGEAGFAVTIDGSGDSIITGFFLSESNFGGFPLNSAGNADVAIAKYSGTNGAHKWSRRFGGTALDHPRAVAADGSGDIFVTGFYQSSSIDFGGGPLPNAGPAGASDIFLAKLRR